MAMDSDKVMFEIYKESTYTGKYRVVYYTELNENNKEWEINKAMSGEHFYDGFIKNYGKDEAKDIIDALRTGAALITRLRSGSGTESVRTTSRPALLAYMAWGLSECCAAPR